MNTQREKKRLKSFFGKQYFAAFGTTLFLCCVSCSSSDTGAESSSDINRTDTTVVMEQETDQSDSTYSSSTIDIPDGYEIISESDGDVDGDAINEKVVVLNTDEEGDMGIEREVRIYVQTDGYWSVWHQYRGPVLASEHGGMMGDPFEKLEIHNQSIFISHFGGSSDKWSYTHEYEYQNDTWELTSATLIYFRNCAYSETFTYDFKERMCFHTRYTESCNEDGLVLEKTNEIDEMLEIDPSIDVPTMGGFSPGGTILDLNGESGDYYL